MEIKKVKRQKITRSVLLGIDMVREFIRREFGPFTNLSYLDVEEVKYPEKEECVINFKTYIIHSQGGTLLFFACGLRKIENEWNPAECIMHCTDGEKKNLNFWRLGLSGPAIFTSGRTWSK